MAHACHVLQEMCGSASAIGSQQRFWAAASHSAPGRVPTLHPGQPCAKKAHWHWHARGMFLGPQRPAGPYFRGGCMAKA